MCLADAKQVISFFHHWCCWHLRHISWKSFCFCFWSWGVQRCRAKVFTQSNQWSPIFRIAKRFYRTLLHPKVENFAIMRIKGSKLSFGLSPWQTQSQNRNTLLIKPACQPLVDNIFGVYICVCMYDSKNIYNQRNDTVLLFPFWILFDLNQFFEQCEKTQFASHTLLQRHVHISCQSILRK